jgi:hypothetical protein
MKRFAGGAIRWMKGSIVTICTSASTYFTISIRARKASIQHNLLETFAIFPLEITDERIISFSLRETVFLKSF